MKKLFIFVAALFISVSAFAGEAWKNFLGFGWRLPTSTTMYVEKSGEQNLKLPVQTGLNFSYTGVLMSNGFSVHAMTDFSFSTSNVDTLAGSELSSLVGFNTDFLVGAGWAPIRTDMFFFGFYGMLGYDITAVGYDSSVFDSNKPKYQQTVVYAAFLPALNATFAWTPVKSFSLYATLSLGYNLPTFIFNEYEANGKTKEETKTLSRGGVKTIPAVGICWKF